MLLYGTFKDINNVEYRVNFITPEEGDSEEIVFGSNPVIITTSSDGLFSPIKSRNATIEITTKKYHFELYNPTTRSVQAIIYKGENVIFKGYVLPSSYNQTYSYLDTIQIECVDALSTLKDYKWGSQWNNISEYVDAENLASQIITGESVTTPSLTNVSTNIAAQTLANSILGTDEQTIESIIDYISFKDIILSILYSCGYRGNLYIPNVYTKVNGKTLNQLEINNIIEGLYCSSANFFDDDAAHTPWTLYDVIKEIFQYLGWSCTVDGDDVWVVDYRSIAQKENLDFSVYDLSLLEYDSEETKTFTSAIDLSSVKAAGTPSLSIDDIFNKIEINGNLYEITDIAPDIFDDNSHISITEEMNLDENEHQWTKDSYKRFLFWKYDQSKEITGYTYQTMCRFKEDTNFKHYFYKHNWISDVRNINAEGSTYEGKDYYNPESESEYTSTGINKYCNTHGCLIQHYSYRPEEGTNNLPTSLEWSDILTFFVTDDTTPTMSLSSLPSLEKKVLTYDIDEEINFKPSSGTSWITIKGDLFYQYNGVQYQIDKTNQVLDIINTNDKWYATCPVDKAVSEIKDKKYCSYSRAYSNADYGKGFGMWKMRVQVGDKYWKDEYNSTTHTYDTGWVDTPTDFYIRYNNNPGNRADEYVPAFEWMTIANNTDYKNKTGVDGYAIPIASDDVDAPSKGKVHITIYTPALLPPEIRDFLYGETINNLTWTSLPPVIYARNFEIGYVYTDSTVWYQQHSKESLSDDVYVANINEDSVTEFSPLEFKLNTVIKNKPISRSYVTLSSGYVESVQHKYGLPYTVDGETFIEKTQEWNVADMYILHHSERKPILEFNVHDYYKPYSIFTYGRWMLQPEDELGLQVPFDFVIDSQSWDILHNKNTIKFISF